MINTLFISLVFLFSQQRRGSFCILISSHKGKKRRSDLPEPYRHTMCNSLFIERQHPEQVTSKVLWNHRYRNSYRKQLFMASSFGWMEFWVKNSKNEVDWHWMIFNGISLQHVYFYFSSQLSAPAFSHLLSTCWNIKNRLVQHPSLSWEKPHYEAQMPMWSKGLFTPIWIWFD